MDTDKWRHVTSRLLITCSSLVSTRVESQGGCIRIRNRSTVAPWVVNFEVLFLWWSPGLENRRALVVRLRRGTFRLDIPLVSWQWWRVSLGRWPSVDGLSRQ